MGKVLLKTYKKSTRISLLQNNIMPWPSLINVGKHHSLDEPPNYPFFQGKKKEGTNIQQNSPSKRIHTHTELLNQL